MEHNQAPSTPLETLRTRIRELRDKRGLTAQQLANLMTDAGIKWDRGTVSKIESGHRHAVSFDEWLTLAYVLNVAPVHMLVPTDDDVPYSVNGEITEDSQRVRAWVAGHSPYLRPPNPDAGLTAAEWMRQWTEEVPKSSHERLLDPRKLDERIIELVDERVAAVLAEREASS